MSKSMYCPSCGAYVGDCGHVLGGVTGPSTLSSTCGKCERQYSVTCNGDCLKKTTTCSDCKGMKTIVVFEKQKCGTCDGSGKVLEYTCQTCQGEKTIKVPKEINCPTCKGTGQV